MERAFRAEVAHRVRHAVVSRQAISLAQAQSQGSAPQQRLDDLQQQFGDEKKSHEGTRVLLVGALTDLRKTGGARGPVTWKAK